MLKRIYPILPFGKYIPIDNPKTIDNTRIYGLFFIFINNTKII
jgi:hypothetical protein